MGVCVLSDGTQHCRCKVHGKCVDFVVNDFSGPGYRNHLGWFHSIRKQLAAGDTVQGKVRLRLIRPAS